MKRFKKDLTMFVRGLKEIHCIQKGLILSVVFHSVIAAFSPFINIYMSAVLLNAIIGRKSFRVLIEYALLIVLLNLTAALLLSVTDRLCDLLQFRFDKYCDFKIANKTMNMDYAKVEDPKTHLLKGKIDDAKTLNNGGLWKMIDCLKSIVKNMLTILFSLSLVYSLFATGFQEGGHTVLNTAIFILFLCLVVVNAFISMHVNTATTRKMHALLNNIVPFNRVFSYYFANYFTTYHPGKDIRIYNAKDLIFHEEMSLFGDVVKTLNSLMKNQIKYSNIASVSQMALSIAVYLFVGLKALAKQIDVGSVLKYVGSFTQLSSGFAGLMSDIASIRANNQALAYYFDFIDTAVTMQRGEVPISAEDLLRHPQSEPLIVFENVSFRYPSANAYSLKNLSLSIRQGEKLAIVGMNGSGKTTFVKLLCGLYDPTEGTIILNDQEIREYHYCDYLKLFSTVFQDFTLYSFSLGQNISSSVEYRPELAEKCLAEARFDRLKGIPQGLEASLYRDFDENGVEISGGEAQKIALARALYKQAPIIVLDEPTAALDPIAEAEVYESFTRISDKTIIMISHRLSSCRFCDRIAVFHEGQLIQVGSHDELLANKKGKYYELWNAQAKYYQ